MTQNNEDSDELKVILVGEPGTGKTSLINVAIGEKFEENRDSTLISTYVQKTIKIDNKEYVLNIWDTAGQEKFRAMTKIFIKNSKIVIFVYAINNIESLKGLKEYWINMIKDSLGDEPILGMVGNKNDLYQEEAIKEEEARKFATENGLAFTLTSAKDNPFGFVEFLGTLLEKYLTKKGVVIKKEQKDTINIVPGNNNIRKEKKCCK